ncbi:MAG: hypothetical protein WBD55_06290 [Dehalococcoidia bacterium]
MPGAGCPETIELINAIFTTPLILNDGHEILARLQAGDTVPQIVEDLGPKFATPETVELARQVTAGWPPLQLEAVGNVVQWALSKLDTDDRVTISWKGDAEHTETVTKFELRDHSLQIEFAHPPVGMPAAAVS